jgi:hypothetical protein
VTQHAPVPEDRSDAGCQNHQPHREENGTENDDGSSAFRVAGSLDEQEIAATAQESYGDHNLKWCGNPPHGNLLGVETGFSLFTNEKAQILSRSLQNRRDAVNFIGSGKAAVQV